MKHTASTERILGPFVDLTDSVGSRGATNGSRFHPHADNARLFARLNAKIRLALV